ncbi:MAG: NAD(+) diphosphatase [Clostridia bacterium]|nr:NAD(+) diphosphatase [Clostridia bacterium]
MIQDIWPHRLRNEFIPGRAVDPEGWLFAFRDGGVFCRIENGAVRLPRVKEASPVNDLRYLFALDGAPCFLDMEGASLPEDWTPVRVGALRSQAEGPREIIFAAWTAFQLYNWYRDNRFCGRCGNETVQADDERALVCPACKRRIYPRIIPAVIVGVISGDTILMTKYRGREISFYALVAGFTEIGETLEETVAREVMEEAGLRVKNIRYYKSQPWAVVDDLLAGFYCDVDGDTTIRMDARELKEAVWVRREDIVGQPNDFSLTHEMMMTFRAGKEPRAQ